jgi:hypothetical protein
VLQRLAHATAQCLVGLHAVERLRQLYLHQRLLRGEGGSLRVKQFETASRALPMAQLHQRKTVTFGLRLHSLRLQLLTQRGIAGQRIRHLAERQLDGFLVLCLRNLAPGLHRGQIGIKSPGIEDRHQQLRGKAPGPVLE